MFNLIFITMKKNEKFETLTKMVGMTGLQISEVVAYWQETGQLKTTELAEKTAAPEQSKDLSGITILPSPKIVTPKVIEAGMFMYADGLIYPEIVEGNRITSVVGYVGKTEGLSVCLREGQLPWSSDLLDVHVPNTSGKEATERITKSASRKKKKAEAAQYCLEYTADGVKAGEAFLALENELELVSQNRELVNTALHRLHAVRMDKKYWSSSVHFIDGRITAVGQNFSDGTGYTDYKYREYYVRPFLAFKL